MSFVFIFIGLNMNILIVFKERVSHAPRELRKVLCAVVNAISLVFFRLTSLDGVRTSPQPD